MNNKKKKITAFCILAIVVLSVSFTQCLSYGTDGLDKFVAVYANDGDIIYSEDGITWGKAETIWGEPAVLPNWQSVCYGNGKYVAAGHRDALGVVVCSGDETNWGDEIRQITTMSDIYSVCYGNGKYVAVGANHGNGVITYFEDWINWEDEIPPSASLYGEVFLGVCYGNGKYVAAGNSGSVAYSTNGIGWTIKSEVFNAGDNIIICYGIGKFFESGKFVVVYGNGNAAYSTNGKDWTKNEGVLAGLSSVVGICYGNGRFVAVDDDGNAAYSSTGREWTIKVNAFYDTFSIDTLFIAKSISYGGGVFVVVGDNVFVYHSPLVAYSKDGVSWKAGDLSSVTISTDPLVSVCYGRD